MVQRERKVDINSLTLEQANEISAQIGEKVREICDKAILDANRILNVYGMEAKMQIVIGGIGELTKESVKKESKPRKASKRQKK